MRLPHIVTETWRTRWFVFVLFVWRLSWSTAMPFAFHVVCCAIAVSFMCWEYCAWYSGRGQHIPGDFSCTSNLLYTVVQIWPGLTAACLHTNRPRSYLNHLVQLCIVLKLNNVESDVVGSYMCMISGLRRGVDEICVLLVYHATWNPKRAQISGWCVPCEVADMGNLVLSCSIIQFWFMLLIVVVRQHRNVYGVMSVASVG